MIGLCVGLSLVLVRLGRALLLIKAVPVHTPAMQWVSVFSSYTQTFPLHSARLLLPCSSVWPDLSCGTDQLPLATQPPAPLPPFKTLIAWSSLLHNRESPPALPWESPAWAWVYHLFLPAKPSCDQYIHLSKSLLVWHQLWVRLIYTSTVTKLRQWVSSHGHVMIALRAIFS